MSDANTNSLKILEDLDTPFRASEAETHGVPRWRLRQLVREEALVELARGLYQLPNAPLSAEIDFISVRKRAPRAIVCLDSALSFWGLSDEIPREIHIAVPRDSHRPRISYPPVRVHEFGRSAFDLGQHLVQTRAGEFAIYGPERSVVDALRMRRTVGRDQALAGLRRYMARDDRDPRKLLEFATALRARGIVEDSLELLLS